LNSRLVDAKEKSANALSGLRAKTLDEAIAAARMTAAAADIEDLDALIVCCQSSADLAAEVQSGAMQAVAAAVHVHHQEELRMTGSALDEQIRRIESTLCAALTERHQISLQMSGGASPVVAIQRMAAQRIAATCG
jgi:hypothetical protein